jgi:cyanobactin maturation PatA/PatG family protease
VSSSLKHRREGQIDQIRAGDLGSKAPSNINSARVIGPDPTNGVSNTIGFESIWAETIGDPSICIAVLDGPVDLSHPCFTGANLTSIQSTSPGMADQRAASQHGTHVASVIFGQGGATVRGIAPGCRGVIIPVFSQASDDSLQPCSQLDLARAIGLAIQHGAHVINISGGQLEPTGQAHPFLANAVRLCAENGVLIVAAAGNEGCQCLHIPAALPSVLAVGAMDSRGQPIDFSNWGESYQAQGILAPGTNIAGAVPGGGTSLLTGTSYATPIMSGVVALLMSVQLKRGEKPNPYAVRKAIISSAIGCDEEPAVNCRRLLAGRLNLVGALSQLKEGRKIEMSEQKTEVPAPNSGAEDEQAQSDGHTGFGMPVTQSSSSGVQAAEFISPQPEAAATSSGPAMRGGQTPGLTPTFASGNITPSGGGAACGCGGGGCSGGPPSLVYALGEIGYDFGTEARRDSYQQHSGKNLQDPTQLLGYLSENPAEAAGIIWTLNVDGTPIYAIQPAGPFAGAGYDRLRESLSAQLNEGAERVSVPGYTKGALALLSGQTVPVIYPEVRGMYSWSTPALVTAVLGKAPAKKEELLQHRQKAEGIVNFLERVYYEIRNLGLAPQERAMNFAATNAFQIQDVYKDAISQNLKLDTIDVEKSPICRAAADCWDVKLTFFDSHKRLEEARKVYRFTVDVSDVVPVTVGKVRSWRVF